MTSWPKKDSCVRHKRLDLGGWDRTRTLSNIGRGHHTLDDRHNSPLLNGRRALETVGINTCIVRLDEDRAGGGFTPAGRWAGQHTSEELRLQVHVVERINGLIVVRLNLS